VLGCLYTGFGKTKRTYKYIYLIIIAGVVAAGLTIATLGYLLKRYSAKKADRIRLEEQKKRKQLKEDASRAGTADMEVIF
jgi:hypothetical protein